GDVMCDVYLRGTGQRLSTEAAVPIFESTGRHQVLGGAANVAANLRALASEGRLLGVVGADAAGCCVRRLLAGQDTEGTAGPGASSRPTTEKCRLVAQQQQVLRLDQESRAALAPDLIKRGLQHSATLLADVDGLVCSDYHKGVCTPELLAPLFAMAQAAK